MTNYADKPLFEKFQALKRHCKLVTVHYLAAKTGVHLEPDCVEVFGSDAEELKVVLDPNKFQVHAEETLELLNDALQELKTYQFMTPDGAQQKRWQDNQAGVHLPLGKKPPRKGQSAGNSKSPWFGRRARSQNPNNY